MLIHTEVKEGFEINCYALPEDTSPANHFSLGSEAEDKEMLGKIESGALTWFCAKVTASKHGIELAAEYLGGCCYNSEQEFVESGGYYDDMVNTVISEAKAAIAKLMQA